MTEAVQTVHELNKPMHSPQPQLPLRLSLKKSLQVHARNDSSACVVLEETNSGKFFRLGPAEGLFVLALMNDDSVEAAAAICGQRSIADASIPKLSSNQIAQICGWLRFNHLLAGDEIDAPVMGNKPAALPLSSFYYLALPLMNPDRWLGRMVQLAGWLFAWQTSVAAVFTCLLGCILMTGRWTEFLANYHNLITPWNGLFLLLAWGGLKLIHEIAHGGTCKRYGGEVRQAGVAFILLLPVAYIDVTSSWKFPTRWQRLHVALAGVAAELGIAGLALLVWYCTDVLAVKQAAAMVVLLASVSSLLFNLNPLLKFDGYYALSDITGTDNLYAYGQSYARYWGARYLLGLDARPPKLPVRGEAWIKAFGMAAALWRALTVVCLIAAAAAIFHGAGIIIAGVGVFTFMLQPLAKLMHHLYSLRVAGSLSAWKLMVRLSGLAVISAGILLAIPGDFRRTMPAVVEYDPPVVLRAPADGFIAQIHVVHGQMVTAGQPIATLRNDFLPLKLLDLQKKLAQAEQQIRSARWVGDFSKVSAAESESLSLNQQLAETQQHVEALVVRSATEGRIVSRHLEALLGTYIEQGEEIVAVGMEEHKRIKVSLSQWEVSRLESWRYQALRVIVTGRPSWSGKLAYLEPRADNTPPDWSLCASHGGPLPVIHNAGESEVLAEERVNAYVHLTLDQSQSLHCGQRCCVQLNCSKQSQGHRLWQNLKDLVQHQQWPSST